MVTQKEFSKIVNLTPQAISKAVRAVPSQLTTIGEGRQLRIDLDGALTHTYIQDRSTKRIMAQEKKQVVKTVDSGLNKNSENSEKQIALPMRPTATNVLRDKELQLKIIKLEMEVQKNLGKLVDRDFVENCFDKMSVIILNYFNPLSTKISPKLSTIYENVDQEKKSKAEQLIQKEISNALNAFSHEIKEIIDSLENNSELEAS